MADHRLVPGTSWQEMIPAFFQPSLNNHARG